MVCFESVLRNSLSASISSSNGPPCLSICQQRAVHKMYTMLAHCNLKQYIERRSGPLHWFLIIEMHGLLKGKTLEVTGAQQYLVRFLNFTPSGTVVHYLLMLFLSPCMLSTSLLLINTADHVLASDNLLFNFFGAGFGSFSDLLTNLIFSRLVVKLRLKVDKKFFRRKLFQF